jgi:hypothetical protein
MVISKGEACTGSAPAYWLERQKRIRLTKILSRPGWPDVVFAFHDKEEIGPRMLARIAKNTGLKPEDL